VSRWVPDEGEIVWIEFDPQVGREQAGHRPAVVLTPAAYNLRSGLLLCVPMTTRIKHYPFEVPIAGDSEAVVLVDHVKSVDWRGRRARPEGRITPQELEDVRQTLRALVG
jgi:mRNA interferase MazF